MQQQLKKISNIKKFIIGSLQHKYLVTFIDILVSHRLITRFKLVQNFNLQMNCCFLSFVFASKPKILKCCLFIDSLKFFPNNLIKYWLVLECGDQIKQVDD